MIDDRSLDVLFREARSYSYWEDKPVDDGLLQQIYDLTKMGPTSANCCPMRIIFIKTPEAKERLKPCLDGPNVDKVMAAPVCAIIAQDMGFYNQLDKLFPHVDAKSWFEGNDNKIFDTAFRNASLQGGYFMLAARAVGLDCGPMSGFDNAKCDEIFFTGTDIKSNFLCNIGYGDKSKLHPRLPRFNFDEACEVI